jgi:hypothetical protein
LEFVVCTSSLQIHMHHVFRMRKRRLWSQNIKRYKRYLLENSFKILHKPRRAACPGSTSAILSARSAENQTYGEYTDHVRDSAFLGKNGLFQVVIK